MPNLTWYTLMSRVLHMFFLVMGINASLPSLMILVVMVYFSNRMAMSFTHAILILFIWFSTQLSHVLAHMLCSVTTSCALLITNNKLRFLRPWGWSKRFSLPWAYNQANLCLPQRRFYWTYSIFSRPLTLRLSFIPIFPPILEPSVSYKFLQGII